MTASSSRHARRWLNPCSQSRFVDRKTLSGSDIRRSRLRLGWSREQLGHQIGVDSDTISLWEQGSLEVGTPIVLGQVFRRYEEASRYAARDTEAEELLYERTR